MAGEPSKLALGTVQFGLDYGVSNTTGKVPSAEVRNILQWCAKENLNTLDTAAAYGNSETVLGQHMLTSENFQIISKLSNCAASEVKTVFLNSLRLLKKNQLYGYLIHDFAAFTRDPQIFDELYQMQQAGLIQKIGFSLYFPQQLEEIIKLKLPIQLIQIPFNVFDQRFTYLLPLLAEKNIEVHVRSVFLQGLVFKELIDLPAYFAPFRPFLKNLKEIAQQTGLALAHIMLAFAHLQPEISKVVVGVTSLKDLIFNNAYVTSIEKVKPFIKSLLELASTDERFILPFNWQLTNG